MAKALLAISSRFSGSRRRCLGHLAGTAALCVTGPLAAGAGTILLRHGPALAQERPGLAPVEMALGSPDAPITVVEYFSFSCSHCARFHRETFPELKRDYIETGKIRFVVRDFPLNLAALTAAALARCIGPERYFDTIDIMWTRWDDWINEAETAPALLSVLGSEGFDEVVLKRCRADKSFEDRVLNSYVEGARDHGVDRTPTFLIDGRKFVGLASYRRFAAILDSLLE